MEAMIGLIFAAIAAISSGIGNVIMLRQLRAANQQIEMAKQQAALPPPSSSGYGLRASNLPFVDSLLGKYEGKSAKRSPTTKGTRPAKYDTIEQFTIDRSEDRITIVGRSLDLKTFEVISRWSGALWKITEDGTFLFGIELNHLGSMEFGTLLVTLQGDVAEGHYYSGAPLTAFINSYTAKKVTEFSEYGAQSAPVRRVEG